MLHLYYTNLENSLEKTKFIKEICEKCRVGYPTVRSWISNPKSKGHRNPKPVYHPIISEIINIEEDELFKI